MSISNSLIGGCDRIVRVCKSYCNRLVCRSVGSLKIERFISLDRPQIRRGGGSNGLRCVFQWDFYDKTNVGKVHNLIFYSPWSSMIT